MSDDFLEVEEEDLTPEMEGFVVRVEEGFEVDGVADEEGWFCLEACAEVEFDEVTVGFEGGFIVTGNCGSGSGAWGG